MFRINSVPMFCQLERVNLFWISITLSEMKQNRSLETGSQEKSRTFLINTQFFFNILETVILFRSFVILCH